MGETTKIRKGPWKAEEDEVLRNHVKKYGPRDWSSIRSKGLLQRTGKSCRLRWVNKLRPNLKSGCKFSPEEERIVIELQSQFGNRWAKIATYLPGRTDNDVKNFWSSRQKRLARLLHLQSQQHKSSHHPNNRRFRKEAVSISLPSIPPTNNHHHQKTVQQSFPPSLFSFSNPNPHHSSTLLSSSSYINNITTTAATDPDINGMLSFDYEASNYGSYLFNNPQFPTGSSSNNPYDELHPQPQPPFSVLPQPPQLFPILSGTQELIDRLDLTFMPEFGSTHHVPSLAPTPDALHVPDNYELPSTPLRLPKVEVSDLKSSGGPQGGGGCDGNETLDPPPLTPDSFFDDFPSDVFDQIESLPSPSHW